MTFSRQAMALLILVGCAFGIGAASILHAQLLLLAVVGAGLLCLLAAPNVAAVLAVATLPFPVTLVPGLPLELAASDLLTVVALVGWALRGALRPTPGPRLRPLAPLALVLAAYGLAMLISLAVHPSGVGVATVLQRSELVVGAILLGAGLVRAGLLRPALEAYLVTASILALGALRYSGSEGILGVQKNPAGGFIAAALFIAIIVRPSRRWWIYAPVLALGLLATQSRGALVGAIVAALVCVLLVRLRERVRLLAAFLTAGALLFLGYLNLPDAARRRLENLSGASDYAIRYRAEFQADALDAFHSSPWAGVGVGNYGGGPRQPGIVDPHQIAYFQLAEGGVILLVAFFALVAGSILVALRRVRFSRLAVAVLAVQLATVVHAFGDIYWVRGTPSMGWILTGALITAVHLARAGDQHGFAWVSLRASPRPSSTSDVARSPLPTGASVG